MPRDAIVSLIAPSPLMENHGAKHFAKTPHSIILKDSLFCFNPWWKCWGNQLTGSDVQQLMEEVENAIKEM